MENSPKILIVEDEGIVALDLSTSLKSLKYNVIGTADSAKAAYSFLEKEMPDLILMDIHIKGNIDGIQAAEQISQLFGIPIIYLTAYTDDDTIQRAKKTSPYGYLLKPFEKRVLHSTIEMALSKSSTEKKLRENEKWLNTILTSIGDAIIAGDKNGIIKYFNPNAEKLTGYSQAEIFEKSLPDFFRLDKDIDLLNSQNISEYTKPENHLMLKNKSGESIPITLEKSTFKIGSEEYSGMVLAFRDITKQLEAEKEKNRLNKEIFENQERLKILSGKLIEVGEVEKRNLARELHDEIGQTLTAIKINLQTIFRYPQSKAISMHVTESVEFVDNVLKQVRNLALDLRPSMLDDLGLVSALRWYIDKQTKRANIKAAINEDIRDKRYPQEIEVTCFRISQETLNNIIKHAEATEIIVDLWEDSDNLNLRISDNGKGFNVYKSIQEALSGKSIGLLGMQERVDLVGGQLKIESKEGEGSSVHAMIPLQLP